MIKQIAEKFRHNEMYFMVILVVMGLIGMWSDVIWLILVTIVLTMIATMLCLYNSSDDNRD